MKSITFRQLKRGIMEKIADFLLRHNLIAGYGIEYTTDKVTIVWRKPTQAQILAHSKIMNKLMDDIAES